MTGRTPIQKTGTQKTGAKSASPLKFTIHRRTDPVAAADRTTLLADPGFGRVFTDHMAIIRYTEGKGWHSAEISARKPLMLDPAAAVLHYAQEIFEGLKAYRIADGSLAMFRPDANASRFQQSAKRLAMPEIPSDLFITSIRELVNIDRDWFPTIEGGSLYIRPFMIATEAFMGVRPAHEYLYLVILSSSSRPSAATSRAARRRCRSGFRRITHAPPPAAPAPPSAAATTHPASSRSPRPANMGATRSCSWMPPSTVGLRNWAA